MEATTTIAAIKQEVSFTLYEHVYMTARDINYSLYMLCLIVDDGSWIEV